MDYVNLIQLINGSEEFPSLKEVDIFCAIIKLSTAVAFLNKVPSLETFKFDLKPENGDKERLSALFGNKWRIKKSEENHFVMERRN